MVVGRSVTVAAVETLLVALIVFAAPLDGCVTTMEAFACRRVKIVSTGWMARVETPPEIQPAVKSIQDASLDMMMVCSSALLSNECTSTTTSWSKLVEKVQKDFRKEVSESLGARPHFRHFKSRIASSLSNMRHSIKLLPE